MTLCQKRSQAEVQANKKQEKISKKLPSHERCLKDKNHPYIKLNTDFVCVTTMSGLA